MVLCSGTDGEGSDVIGMPSDRVPSSVTSIECSCGGHEGTVRECSLTVRGTSTTSYDQREVVEDRAQTYDWH